MISSGYFVIADISGYTEFLTQSGLEEAHGVLDHLFDGFLESVREPLKISNFQGDAVFAFARAEEVMHGQSLFDSLENIYFSFAGLVEQMQRTAACSCDACDNLPKLDLKLIVHFGQYVTQHLRGREELTGPDVILVHRMLKNHVLEQTGLRSYLLLSDRAKNQLALDVDKLKMETIAEEYDHLGVVQLYVYNLRTEYERRKNQQRHFVKPGDAHVYLEKMLPSLPYQTWEFLTQPGYLRMWMAFDHMLNLNDTQGKLDRGTVFQCLRNTDRLDYVITDWRPFQYLTIESTLDHIPYVATYSLIQMGNETFLRFYYCATIGATTEFFHTIRNNFEISLGRLEAMIKLSQKSGEQSFTEPESRPS